MSARLALIVSAVLVLFVLGCEGQRDGQTSTLTRPEVNPAKAKPPAFGLLTPPSAEVLELPFLFEEIEDRGQRGAQFVVRRPGYDLIASSDGLVSVLADRETDDTKARKLGKVSTGEYTERKSVALNLTFTDANKSVTITPERPSTVKVNYYVGSDRSAWRQNVPVFTALRYNELYKATDMVLASDRGQLSYRFEIGPKGDPQSLRMNFQNARAVRITKSGELKISLPNGRHIVHQAPRAFDSLGKDSRAVSVHFKKMGKLAVGFEIAGRRDGSALTIDPVIDFGTYFGGTNNEPLALGTLSLPLPAFDIAVDGDGRLLIAGATFSGDLPRHSGTAISWSGMAFAARLDPDHPSGPRYDYVNYFTGNGDDRATAISPGVSGDAYVCGRTSSTDFPAWSGAFDWKPPTAGSAGFVLHLDTNGQLRRTSFIKAAETTTIFDCTFADASAGKPGGLYFTGRTHGDGVPINPLVVTAGAPQTSIAGGSDAIVGKLTPALNQLEYFTLLGGLYSDWGLAIEVKNSSAVITGLSESPDFPLTIGAYAANHTMDMSAAEVCDDPIHTHKCWETFVARLNSNGDNFEFVTFLDDDLGDFASAIAVDENFDVYVAGQHYMNATEREAYTVKLSSDGGTLLNRLNFGGNDARVFDIAVDANRVVHLTGQAHWITLATGYPVDATWNGDMDGFYASLNPSGNLDYFTYLGGEGFDAGYSLALGSDACVFLGLETRSDFLDIPLPGAPQSARAGSSDILILRHCSDLKLQNLSITKELVTDFAEPGGIALFRILVENPGPWRAGPFSLRDAIPFPFDLLAAQGPGCSISGQTVSCTFNGLPTGITGVSVRTVNRLTCDVPGEITNRINTARLTLPNGTEITHSIEVPFRDCLYNLYAPCRSTADCAFDLLCVKRCAPEDRNRNQYLYGNAMCVPPESVSGCDWVLR
mgnify:FL=1